MAELNQWIPFDSNLLSENQLKTINDYCEITNQKPTKLFFVERKSQVMVCFKEIIYHLTKDQIVLISELDFVDYIMDDYSCSILTLDNHGKL